MITKNVFPKGKKAVNDISIIALIIFIFFGTAIIIPFVNAEFDTEAIDVNEEGITQQIKDEARSVSVASSFQVLVTVTKLALYDFGNTLGLPFWFDAIYTVLAIIFILVVARNIWVGGGA